MKPEQPPTETSHQTRRRILKTAVLMVALLSTVNLFSVYMAFYAAPAM